MIKDCYGNYKRKSAKCADCDPQIKLYCKDAGDPSKTAPVNYDDVSYSEEYGESESPFDLLSEAEKTDNAETQFPSALAACVFSIFEIKKTHPSTAKILIRKLQHPFEPDWETAEKFGCSRVNITQRINSIIQLYPDLKYMLRGKTINKLFKTNPSRTILMLQAAARAVSGLSKLESDHPETFKYAKIKIQSPHLSYSQIGKRYGCRKQNVQYHLKKAERLLSALHEAFLVDRRGVRNKST